VATLTPGAAFVRVGVLDVVELGAQLGSSIWPRVKGQLLRGKTNLALRAGGSPWSRGVRGATTDALVSYKLGGVEPVLGAGVGWLVDQQRRAEPHSESAPANGALGFASLGIRVPLIRGLAVHPEITGFRSVTGDSVGWTAGVAWVFTGFKWMVAPRVLSW